MEDCFKANVGDMETVECATCGEAFVKRKAESRTTCRACELRAAGKPVWNDR